MADPEQYACSKTAHLHKAGNLKSWFGDLGFHFRSQCGLLALTVNFAPTSAVVLGQFAKLESV